MLQCCFAQSWPMKFQEITRTRAIESCPSPVCGRRLRTCPVHAVRVELQEVMGTAATVHTDAGGEGGNNIWDFIRYNCNIVLASYNGPARNLIVFFLF